MGELTHIGKILEEMNLPMMKRKADIWRFVTAGNATFTIESDKIGKRYTYNVIHRKNDNVPHRYLVYRLYGPDNTNDYRYIGLFYSDTLSFTWNSPAVANEDASRMIKYFLSNIIHTTTPEWPDTCHFYMSGKCACCGRKLTTPESIERGIGPKCWENL